MAKTKITSEEKKEIIERLKREPEAIKEYEDLIYADDKFFRDALAKNGECLYYVDKRFRANTTYVLLAAGTNPEWYDILDPREMGKKSTVLCIGASMLANGFRKIANHNKPGFNADLKEYMDVSYFLFRLV